MGPIGPDGEDGSDVSLLNVYLVLNICGGNTPYVDIANIKIMLYSKNIFILLEHTKKNQIFNVTVTARSTRRFLFTGTEE